MKNSPICEYCGAEMVWAWEFSPPYDKTWVCIDCPRYMIWKFN